MRSKTDWLNRLTPFRQQHLLAFWDELDSHQRASLSAELEQIDLAAIRQFFEGADFGENWQELAERARPPRAIRLHGANEFAPQAAAEKGASALRAGQVAMILVAGGQGSRLGFPHPKGMFPLGPVSHRTLFQILIDRLQATARRYGVRIPLYVMTSPATHAETEAYFLRKNNCGMPAGDLRCFCQGTMPAVCRATGKILLESHSSLALSPDGHGGMLAALARSGCLDDLQRRGIQLIFYGQVDNPLLQICDPALLGFHLLAGSEMTTQVVAKRHALEPVGNVAEIDGQTRIIEYSDLPDSVAQRTTPEGKLLLWAGNMAVHVFSVDFLSRQVGNARSLPIHRAVKKVPHIDSSGAQIQPPAPNAVKFERFIFDLLPQARTALVVEADPAEAFAPVKNASGAKADTPETAQAAMVDRDRRFLQDAGIACDPGVAVEINPLWAFDSAEIRDKLPAGYRVTTPTYFEPNWSAKPQG